MPEKESCQSKSTLSLQDLASVVLAAVAVIGVLVYGLLAAAYDEFYSELGLTPADVGVEYGKALGGAAALAVLVSLLIGSLAVSIALILSKTQQAKGNARHVYALCGVIVLAVLCIAAYWNLGLLAALTVAAAGALIFYGSRSQLTPHWRLGMATAAAITTCWLLLATVITYEANEIADSVKAGYWVKPPQSGELVIFSVRAMPVELSPVGTAPEAQKLVSDVDGHTLLFLGQSTGQFVIYDATNQEALILPISDFHPPILNCETGRERIKEEKDRQARDTLCREPPR